MLTQAKEADVKAIAEMLLFQREKGQRAVLFLGARTGGLFANEYFYETLQQFSLLNFDLLSNAGKFEECHSVLRGFTEIEKHNILVGALSTLRYREEDKLLVSLVKAGFFETIITTNIDNLLEDAFNSSGSQEPDDYQIIVPESDNIAEIERNKPQYSSIIKAFGDLNSRHYYTAGEAFELQAVDSLRNFLKSKSSKEILMVGFDSVWDHEIEQIFPSNGRTMWYAKERESYSNFIRMLYKYLGGETRRNEATTVPKPSLLQALDKEKKEVFISYSHQDRKYLERLAIHLKGYSLKDTVVTWDETKISSGSDWKKEIKRALTQAKVIVLLISTHYLSSLLSTEELPILLEAARSEDVKLLPIILEPSLSLFRDDQPLNNYQVVNSSSKPLAWMKPYEQEVIWNKLAERVYSILHS